MPFDDDYEDDDEDTLLRDAFTDIREVLFDCSTLPMRERIMCRKDGPLRVMLTFCDQLKGRARAICLKKIEKEYGMARHALVR